MASLEKLRSALRAFLPGGRSSCRSPALVFASFQAVLESNNRALEIIADIGEKLSGDFLFDRRYIETSVDDLIQSVRRSIDEINHLTGDRCLSLRPIADALAERLRTLLAGRDDRGGPLLIDLDKVEFKNWPRVGGKAAHLAEINQNPPARVPEGFVITTRAFHDLVDGNGLRRDLDSLERLLADPAAGDAELERRCRALREKIAGARMPADLAAAIADGLRRLRPAGVAPRYLAVRSSALEEDMDFSFAGQFHSVMQVENDSDAISTAYLEVVASLFNIKAMRYRRQLFPEGSPLAIAACCQRMIDARASGILYTVDPTEPRSAAMVVVGSYGQGQAVVEGQVPTDYFRINKENPPRIVDRAVARKTAMLLPAAGGGLGLQAVAAGDADRACLDDGELLRLAASGEHLETLFKRPQDIEWCIDRQGELYILQSRPLLLMEGEKERLPLAEKLEGYQLIAADAGRVAQRGIGAGRAYRVDTYADLKDFPEGAVLLTHRDASYLVPVMRLAAAIVTEVGTPLSHMATLCREFRVPCLVGVGDAVRNVETGTEITVDAEDRRIYRGRVHELLTFQAATAVNLEMTPEFRLLRRVQREVSRLNLVDPLMQEFRPEGCQTFHDVLRYIHETAVLELVDLGRDEGCLLGDSLIRPLTLPIPAGILVLDIGGGIAPGTARDGVDFQAVASAPFRAILEGMLFPEVWHDVPMHVGFRDMMHSMLATPRDTLTGQYTGHNIAIISRNYVNLCFRFGYHFNIIDAHCHEVERDNHIYFRFLGGASDLSKRSRRAALIAMILKAFDFNVQIKGDLVISRASNMMPAEVNRTLEILGRLIGFTRQLDVQMESDALVERYAEAFLMGDYGIVARGG
ncbi:MAG: PEP/pyruvate-binding domain-containing protein [Thermodesulfobacteriota bacterium]